MTRSPIQYACNSEATFLEALGLAGDLTIFARQEEHQAVQFGLAGIGTHIAEFKRPKHA